MKEKHVKALYIEGHRKKEGEYESIIRQIEALNQDLNAIADTTKRFEESKKLSTLIKRHELKRHLISLPAIEKKKIIEMLLNPDNGGKITIEYARVGDVREESYDDPNLVD